MLRTKTRRKIHYPDSDGKPMAETPAHVLAIMMIHQALEDFFRSRQQQAWVTSNIFWYYSEGDRKKRVSPDTMAILDKEPQNASFKSWEQPADRPAVVFELTSKKTRDEDTSRKFDLYESLGVPEYFLFDPTGDYLRPRLQGYRLQNNQYLPIPSQDGIFASALGFGVAAEFEMLRMFDMQSGEKILTRRERFEDALAEIERLKSENERLRNAGKNGNHP
jgi:Uma2 family endonuclease